MANPQKENGYTPIANEILDEMARRKFSGSQLRILMVIWRYTYGYQRKSRDFSLSFLAEKTGLNKDTVKQQIKKLFEQKVIVIFKEATFSSPREIGFNKNYEEWLTPVEDPQVDKNNRGGQMTTSTGGQSTTSTGGQMTPHIKKRSKETLKKNSGGEYIPARDGTVGALEADQNFAQAYKIFKTNFFHADNDIQRDMLAGFVDAGLEPAVIEKAAQITRANGKDLKYFWGILRNCVNRGTLTLEAFEQDQERFEKWRSENASHWHRARGDPGTGEEDVSAGYFTSIPGLIRTV